MSRQAHLDGGRGARWRAWARWTICALLTLLGTCSALGCLLALYIELTGGFVGQHRDSGPRELHAVGLGICALLGALAPAWICRRLLRDRGPR